MIKLNVRIRFWLILALFVPLLSANAPPGRYTDETGAPLTVASTQVKDTVTGLIWQRGNSNGSQTWSSSAAAGSAQAYCIDLPLGGVTWRLPAIKELFTLVDRSLASGATIDPIAFPGTPANFFWSSTVLQSNSSLAWGVYFDYGYTFKLVISSTYCARCVR